MTKTLPLSNLEHTFTQLPPSLYAKVEPTPVAAPSPVLLNHTLAGELGFYQHWLSSPEALQILSGNQPPSDTIAMAYAGHQFGQLNPRLGDGRAHLLGEIITPDGQRLDMQLKGSGITPYSRQGDGRAPLGPVLREYLVSEFMQALGVPTSRSLAAIATGENVWRQGAEPGAVLTRVAASHIRVGSFEYAARQSTDCVAQLADYTLQRHFPAQHMAAAPYLSLLQEVVAKQAQLIAHWMSVGFIHGVMNTDNMLVCGQTIDYGPCAFMDHYVPQQVYSFIDRQGRYRYDHQAGIGQWNLVRLAETLVPVMHMDAVAADIDQTVALAQQAINDYQQQYEQAYAQRMINKLGLSADGSELVTELLAIMAQDKLDYTLTFRYLMTLLAPQTPAHAMPDNAFSASAGLQDWQGKWLGIVQQKVGSEQALALMAQHNPIFLPRNHLLAAALQAAYQEDISQVQALLEATSEPFTYRPEWQHLALPPQPEEKVANTFCGT
ncbi:MAG: YdiU family protein [Gammaproteobacteria bacterium]|nr:YdiU family protein [Gammaproteobacteria bacterium]